MEDLSEESPDLDAKICSIVEGGNELDDEGKKTQALAAYIQAWELLPEPKLGWKLLTGWIAGSLYNFYFDNGDFKNLSIGLKLHSLAEVPNGIPGH
ncbi:hypothetical protein NTD80_15095 [Pseudomonas sp. 13B_2.1_Bac1]|uniref:hypothetical protein n=1 Tax=Pseudomonas sp. 13B_2.1_Bac1 TaxID=2971624 RepID=UPI0021C56A70|nr:hypothetical protein [Pseudomonas sp. 13B_2.1_Bac1]MCU1784082.1 hypothetical protein [Pseudomonas sp. 13B_2.1_Bac1]